jgi:hypothetical protein
MAMAADGTLDQSFSGYPEDIQDIHEAGVTSG